MKTFQCLCGAPLFFENTQCRACGRKVAFSAEQMAMVCVDAAEEKGLKLCDNNVKENVCNWLVDDGQALCRACRLNHTIPNLEAHPAHRLYWARLESAKRRAVYSLLSLGLPVRSKTEDPEKGLAFSFMADADPDSEFTEFLPGVEKIYTGHDSGHIVINLAEADEIARTRARLKLGERYRTILGHFRHELGHYYWDLLIADSPWLEPCRKLFGDDRLDYGEAIDRHYKEGPPKDWEENYVSAYATMHPWEDWAETWSHYIHMVDTLDTAHHFTIAVQGRHIVPRGTPQDEDNPERAWNFERLFTDWLMLVVPLNELNRSMGYDEPYPFVLTDPIKEKLHFVHQVLKRSV
jgi:hypothetical protein